jgi:hypothetical protein
MVIESERILTNVPGMEGQSVVIKKLGYASLSQLRSKSVNAKLGGSTMRNLDAEIDMGAYHKWMLIYGIKHAPFFASCITLDDRSRKFDEDLIPADSGEFLFNEIQKFNGFSTGDDLKKE